MKQKTLFAGGALAVALCVGGAAFADDSANTPGTGGAKPGIGNGPAEQHSVPNAAPPATRTNNTGASDQSGSVKAMNQKEKSKTETEGK